MLVMKSGKRQMTDGKKLPNQDKIRSLGEKETYKWILEAATIKQVEMKDKIQKDSRQNSLVETSSKEKIPSLNIRDPFSSGPEINLNKWTKEHEN